MSSISNNIIWVALVILFFGCKDSKTKDSRVEVLPFYNEATFTPKWIVPDDPQLKDFHRISDFSLFNQNGDTITRRSLANKIYVTDFFFATCPGICPKMMANMEILQTKFINDDDILLVSHSVTPKRDSILALKKYAEDKGIITDKWHLLTGDRSQIYKLGRQDYFIEEDLGLEMDEDDFLHTENFVLVDKNGYLRGIYNGLNLASVEQLIADIYTLKKEK